MRVIGFDHLVIISGDVERSLEFYCGRLGLAPVRIDEWRQGKVPFPSVRISPTSIIDIVKGDRSESNVDHFCLVVERLDWQQVIDSGELTVIDFGTRFGAQGYGESVYINDPDGNTIELRWYA